MSRPKYDPYRITVEEAIAAARAAAFTESFDEDDEESGREPRTLLHSFTTSGIAIGADWDLDGVVDFIERSEDRAWNPHIMFGHELLVVTDDRMIAFDAQRDKHGATDVR
jgi:hypothetical protein